MNLMNWTRKGPWWNSGNGNWTAEMSELSRVDTVEDSFLPGLDTMWTEVPWKPFQETREDVDGWEWTNPISGTKYVIFND